MRDRIKVRVFSERSCRWRTVCIRPVMLEQNVTALRAFGLNVVVIYAV